MRLEEERMVWSSRARQEASGNHLLVLLHGAGGVPDDLTPCFEVLPPGISAVSLGGPIAAEGRWAWAHLDEPDPDGLRDSARAVSSWLDSLRGFSSVGLLGFSQGAAVVIEMLRHCPQRVVYAVVLSGLLPSEVDDRDGEVARHSPPVFMGTGNLDDVIPPEETRALRAWLRRHTAVTEHRYPTLGHGMSSDEIRDAISFAERHLGSSQ
ncbi:MAG: dienelactone hydrolase family protein [Brooklawnia sp.]|uniref:alpha/beta hydrolase n=1 Tax=Brooklawnia sp. TaxID=2699740 RepID=UPI003C764F68